MALRRWSLEVRFFVEEDFASWRLFDLLLEQPIHAGLPGARPKLHPSEENDGPNPEHDAHDDQEGRCHLAAVLAIRTLIASRHWTATHLGDAVSDKAHLRVRQGPHSAVATHCVIVN
jgi:hypothetical protein